MIPPIGVVLDLGVVIVIHICRSIRMLLENLLKEHFKGAKYVGDIRGRGLFWATEFVNTKRSKKALIRALGLGAKSSLELSRWLFQIPGSGTLDGWKGDHVLFAPPFTVLEQELVRIVVVMRKAYDVEKAAADAAVGASRIIITLTNLETRSMIRSTVPASCRSEILHLGYWRTMLGLMVKYTCATSCINYVQGISLPSFSALGQYAGYAIQRR